jgi:hypothetical protein
MIRGVTVPVMVALLATTGCGIPHDATPTTMPGGIVEPALAAVDRRPESPDVQAELFLVQAQQLVKARRSTPRRDLADVLTRLLKGPTEAEFSAGIRSAISTQTTLRSARQEGDTAVIDLSGALVEVGGPEQILAVAQLVLTATAIPGISQVRFLLEGQAVEVPRSDGTLTSETLRATDYASLLR